MRGYNMPNGFIPRSATTGAPVNAAHINPNYQIKSGYATSLYRGDIVYLSPADDAGQGYIIKYPILAAGSQVPVLGIFQGVQYIDANGVPQDKPYWLASTPIYANTVINAVVADAQSYLFEAQVSKSGAATLAAPTLVQADIGCTFNYGEGALTGAAPWWSGSAANQYMDPADQPNNPTGGDVYRGSAQFIDYTKRFAPQAANGNLAIFRLEAIFPGPENRAGLFFNTGLFKINNHQFANGQVSV